MHLCHKYRLIDATLVEYLSASRCDDTPYKLTTRMLLGCSCGKTKVKEISGHWEIEDLRKARNEA
jgi:hypothetical protein